MVVFFEELQGDGSCVCIHKNRPLVYFNYLERPPTNAGCFSFPNANKRSFTFSAFTIFRATPVSMATLATAAATWAATLGIKWIRNHIISVKLFLQINPAMA